jgi:predicted nucleic acid-binding protein
MSEPAVVADTSALIHLMDGHPDAEQWILGREVNISVATEIELRTISNLRRSSKAIIERTLALCSVWDIGPIIKDRCIEFRSTYKLKLADALIAATAASLNLPLVTSDQDFKKLKNELDMVFI